MHHIPFQHLRKVRQELAKVVGVIDGLGGLIGALAVIGSAVRALWELLARLMAHI